MKHLISRFKLLFQGKWWAFWHYGESGFTHLYFRGKPIVFDEKNNTSYMATYSTYKYANGPIRCGWCDKDISRLGSKRLNSHLDKHEEE